MELDSGEGPRPKRPAEDDLENEQRLTKRLGRLRIGMNSFLRSVALYLFDADPSQNWPIATVPPSSSNNTALDHMSVDETRDRVYIHDIDSELAELEEQKSDIAFLPEIEKRLAALPTTILGGANQEVRNKQMVLYQVPSSISVPEEQDHVRKAIIATRAREKEKPTPESTVASSTENLADQMRRVDIPESGNMDAMDID